MTVFEHNFINYKEAGSPLDIAPVAGRIGAEVRGINLAWALDDVTVAAIRAALNHHKVIFFRNQAELDDTTHEQLAARLGNPVAHPTVPVAEGSKYLLELDSREGYAASSWHTDVTFVEAYPAISILRAINIPAAGGDTQWANTASAYAELPDALKILADNLWAVHTNLYDYASALNIKDKAYAAQHQNVFASTVYETEHPVVHVHPETGERNLLVGHFVKNFVGLNNSDSQRLLQTFQEHITKPENVVRWRWQEGDIAIWDNRATQHRAVADFGLQRRTLRRATVAGIVPVSITGKSSRTLKKEPGNITALQSVNPGVV
jgi:taurine dioxygenase